MLSKTKLKKIEVLPSLTSEDKTATTQENEEDTDVEQAIEEVAFEIKIPKPEETVEENKPEKPKPNNNEPPTLF